MSLAVWIWIIQRISFTINIGNDTLIAALLAGVFSGSGIGLVFDLEEQQENRYPC